MKIAFPYEDEKYDLETTPSAAATIGTFPEAAISMPLWFVPHLPPYPEE